MGYKLAGFNVIGNCEIDEAINAMYVKNHSPTHNYRMDIRDLLKRELPRELYALDILDGSPPCSAFSLAGRREKNWGKEKAFREGQATQTLDDLFFRFIALAERLKPKIVVAENVKGITVGKARGYVNQILSQFRAAGYAVQMFLLNSAFMEVPQTRERVFFVARRNDLGLPDIKLEFNHSPIPFGEVRSERGEPFKTDSKHERYLKLRKATDKAMDDIYKRVEGRGSCFGNPIVSDGQVCPTVTAGGLIYRMHDGLKFSAHDLIATFTFPEDYDFCGLDVKYVCGMSVPPMMMYHIAAQIRAQWMG